MGRPRSDTPSLRRQTGAMKRDGTRGPDRAFVVIDGQRRYLGAWGTRESKAKYHALLAEHAAGIREVPTIEDDDQCDMAIAELVVLYLDHLAQRHEQGRLARPGAYDPAMDTLVELYGPMPICDFAPKHLIAIQQLFVQRGWHSRTVNERVSQIRRMFRWGIPREYTTAAQSHALEQVESVEVAYGEDRPVKPAPRSHVRRARRHMPLRVRIMVDLQLLTGARPGELCILRPMDVDRSNSNLWQYRPSRHKNERRGQDRVIYIGPRAQRLLAPFLDRPATDFAFSPDEGERERRQARHEARVTPLQYGNRPGTNRKASPRRRPQDRYHTSSYRRAIYRACDAADVPQWSPNQLRHNFATWIRAKHGVDVAATLLGHSKVETTQIYAEQNHAKAREIVRMVG